MNENSQGFCNSCYNAYSQGYSWHEGCTNFYNENVWPLDVTEYCAAVPLTDFLPLLIIAGMALAFTKLYNYAT